MGRTRPSRSKRGPDGQERTVAAVTLAAAGQQSVLFVLLEQVVEVAELGAQPQPMVALGGQPQRRRDGNAPLALAAEALEHERGRETEIAARCGLGERQVQAEPEPV